MSLSNFIKLWSNKQHHPGKDITRTRVTRCTKKAKKTKLWHSICNNPVKQKLKQKSCETETESCETETLYNEMFLNPVNRLNPVKHKAQQQIQSICNFRRIRTETCNFRAFATNPGIMFMCQWSFFWPICSKQILAKPKKKKNRSYRRGWPATAVWPSRLTGDSRLRWSTWWCRGAVVGWLEWGLRKFEGDSKSRSTEELVNYWWGLRLSGLRKHRNQTDQRRITRGRDSDFREAGKQSKQAAYHKLVYMSRGFAVKIT